MPLDRVILSQVGGCKNLRDYVQTELIAIVSKEIGGPQLRASFPSEAFDVDICRFYFFILTLSQKRPFSVKVSRPAYRKRIIRHTKPRKPDAF